MANPELQSLNTQIEKIVVTLDEALMGMGELKTKSTETGEAVAETVNVTRGTIDGLVGSVESDLDGLQEKTSQTVDSVGRELSSAKDKVEVQGSAISALLEEIIGASATALDDLTDFLEDKGDEFSVGLRAQIELLELGIITVDEINNSYGDALINGVKLRDILEGLDTVGFAQDIQALAAELRTGGAEIGQILQFLTERGGALGKSFADWIEKARAGEITMQRFRDEIRKLLAALESLGGDTSGLAGILDGIEDLIQSESTTG